MMVAPPAARTFDLAQVNIALPREAHLSSLYADFIAALTPINALTESTPGFVWRFQDGGGNAGSVRKFGNMYRDVRGSLANVRAALGE